MDKEIKIFNKNIKFTTFMIFVIVLGVVFGTFALVIANAKVLGINATVGDIKVNISYDGGSSSISSSGTMAPISDSEVTGPSVTDDRVLVVKFSVSGSITNPSESIYDVVLRDLDLPSYFRNSDVKWRLYKNNALLSNGTFSPSFDVLENNRMVLTNIQQDLTTSSDSYVFLMWISETCTGDVTACSSDNSQNKYLNKTFTGNIRIETATKTKKALTRPVAAVGDINGDGNINTVDAAMLRGYLNGTYTFTQQQMYNADINGDGVIDVFDAKLCELVTTSDLDNELPKEYIADYAFYGDMTGDDVIDSMDAAIIIAYVNGAKLTSQRLNNADVNADGIIDINDYALVLSYFNGLITGNLPSESLMGCSAIVIKQKLGTGDATYSNSAGASCNGEVGKTTSISGTSAYPKFDSVTCSNGYTPTIGVGDGGIDGCSSCESIKLTIDNLTSNTECVVTFK